MNALRHGLTGRVVVLPSEDTNAYRAFCAELMTDLAPETAVERQYAQTFCDTQWRLNRARSYEDSMLALGLLEHPADTDDDHPEIHAALTASQVFRENSKAFVNLSLYEQRLQRTLKESLRQLQELQASRIAAKKEIQKEETRKEAGVNPHKTKKEPADQFVYSTPGIEPEPLRQNDCADPCGPPLRQAA